MAKQRTSYLVEVAKRAVKLHRQREALLAAKGIWKDEDHPELAEGSYEYVRKMRSLDNERMERIEMNRKLE